MNANSSGQETFTFFPWLIRIPLGILILVTIILLVNRNSLNHQFEAELDAIKEASNPLTFRQVADRYGSLLSIDNENPQQLYLEAFALLEEKLMSPEGRQPRHYVNELLPVRHWSSEAAERVALFLWEHQREIELIEEASRTSPSGFPLAFHEAFDLELPHLQQLQTASHLFQIKALHHARRGEREAALGALETVLYLPDSLRNEPLVFSITTRVELERQFFTVFRDILELVEFTPAQLQRLKDLLEYRDAPMDFASALKAERVLALHFFALSRKDRNQEIKKLLRNPSFLLPYALLLYERVGLFHHDRLAYLHGIDRYLEINPRSIKQRLTLSLAFEVERIKGNEMTRFYSSLLLPRLYPPFQRDALRLAENRLARMALTLEKNRLETGYLHATGLPEELALMEDPFTGAPLSHRFLPDGELVLYSVGPYGTGTGEAPDDIRILIKNR